MLVFIHIYTIYVQKAKNIGSFSDYLVYLINNEQYSNIMYAYILFVFFLPKNKKVCENDRIIVNVKNQLRTETLSIHWHGIHQTGSLFMDGLPFVSQYPIQPLGSFRYEFIAEPHGTQLWHGHSGTYNLKLYFFLFKNHILVTIYVNNDLKCKFRISRSRWFVWSAKR